MPNTISTELNLNRSLSSTIALSRLIKENRNKKKQNLVNKIEGISKKKSFVPVGTNCFCRLI